MVPYSFHKQNVTAREIKFLYDRANNVNFGEFEKNPYAISDQEYEQQTKTTARINSRGVFHKERSKIRKSNVAFYRENSLFSFPMIYANIKLSLQTSSAIPNATSIAYTYKMMLLTHIWRHKLRVI